MNEETLVNVSEALNYGKTSSGIGLSNIHQRLHLSYGDGYGVTIHSAYGIGTTVTIKIPTIRGKGKTTL